MGMQVVRGQLFYFFELFSQGVKVGELGRCADGHGNPKSGADFGIKQR